MTPYGWTAFLRERLDSHSSVHLLDGLTKAGYRLAYTETPTEAFRQQELDEGVTDLSFSIGLTVDERGMVRAVAWDKPAFRAGLVMGARLLSVNGATFTLAKLQEAVANAKIASVDITYVVDGLEHAVQVDYKGGLRYPKLERVSGVPDLLAPLLQEERVRPARANE